jgi:hypothetical protein
MDANAVFHQEHHELFPIREGDWCPVRLGGLLDDTGAEIIGSDDQFLFVYSQVAVHLLYDRSLDGVLELPLLGLGGNLDADDSTHKQGPAMGTETTH